MCLCIIFLIVYLHVNVYRGMPNPLLTLYIVYILFWEVDAGIACYACPTGLLPKLPESKRIIYLLVLCWSSPKYLTFSWFFLRFWYFTILACKISKSLKSQEYNVWDVSKSQMNFWSKFETSNFVNIWKLVAQVCHHLTAPVG